jgi:hypothetical protein
MLVSKFAHSRVPGCHIVKSVSSGWWALLVSDVFSIVAGGLIFRVLGVDPQELPTRALSNRSTRRRTMSASISAGGPLPNTIFGSRRSRAVGSENTV